MTEGSEGGEGPTPPQLHMWDAEEDELKLGTLEADDGDWILYLLVERPEPDLVRGRLSFRQEEARHDTAAVLVEESEEEVLRKARELTPEMLRQLLISARA